VQRKERVFACHRLRLVQHFMVDHNRAVVMMLNHVHKLVVEAHILGCVEMARLDRLQKRAVGAAG
jgi:hypothetical protein